jgi:hemerythrin
MKHIVWGQELELGIPAIDSQHRQLVRLVNELNDALTAKNRPKAELIFEEVLDYLVCHFEFEERLQEKAGYCYAKAHRRVHEIFMRKVNSLRDHARSGEGAALELLQMLKKWLTHHIRNEDFDYVEALQHYLEASTPEVSDWPAAA